MRTIAAVILAGVGAAIVFATAGCSSIRSACELAGVCDPPALQPVAIDLLTDLSDGSTVDLQAFSNTLDTLLSFVAARPGSSLRAWILGTDAPTTKVVSPPIVSEAGASAVERIRQRRAEEFVKRGKTQLMEAFAPYFTENRPRKSPIAEAITKIAFSTYHDDHQQILVVMSDGRQFSSTLGDWECAVPDIEKFARALREHDVLQPQLLAGTSVVFTRFDLVEVAGGRCAATIASNRQIERLWRESLTVAGASQVTFMSATITRALLDSFADAGSKLEAKR